MDQFIQQIRPMLEAKKIFFFMAVVIFEKLNAFYLSNCTLKCFFDIKCPSGRTHFNMNSRYMQIFDAMALTFPLKDKYDNWLLSRSFQNI